MDVAGTRLFVYDLGARDAPALLYLHGGPGMGCHEFVRWQGAALARRGLRVVAFDQRGTHHSDPVAAEEELTESVLVDDCRALRERLGLDRLFVLGHSFGGRIALRYAARYPENTAGVVFENPGWDPFSTERIRMPALAEIYAAHGDDEKARECLALARRENPFAEGYRVDLIAGTASLGESWYLYDRSDTALLGQERLAVLDEEADERAAEKLIAHPALLEDLTPLLAGVRARGVPARLIVGEADLVTAPRQIEAFARAFGAGAVARVAEAAHFVQGEQREVYAGLVADFVHAAVAAPGPSAVSATSSSAQA